MSTSRTKRQRHLDKGENKETFKNLLNLTSDKETFAGLDIQKVRDPNVTKDPIQSNSISSINSKFNKKKDSGGKDLIATNKEGNNFSYTYSDFNIDERFDSGGRSEFTIKEFITDNKDTCIATILPSNLHSSKYGENLEYNHIHQKYYHRPSYLTTNLIMPEKEVRVLSTDDLLIKRSLDLHRNTVVQREEFVEHASNYNSMKNLTSSVGVTIPKMPDFVPPSKTTNIGSLGNPNININTSGEGPSDGDNQNYYNEYKNDSSMNDGNSEQQSATEDLNRSRDKNVTNFLKDLSDWIIGNIIGTEVYDEFKRAGNIILGLVKNIMHVILTPIVALITAVVGNVVTIMYMCFSRILEAFGFSIENSNDITSSISEEVFNVIEDPIQSIYTIVLTVIYTFVEFAFSLVNKDMIMKYGYVIGIIFAGELALKYGVAPFIF